MLNRAPTSPARPGMRMRRMTPARLVRALSLLQAGAWTISHLAAEADLGDSGHKLDRLKQALNITGVLLVLGAQALAQHLGLERAGVHVVLRIHSQPSASTNSSSHSSETTRNFTSGTRGLVTNQ